MVDVSRNTGSAPLIGSKVIRDRAPGGSVWRKKGSSDPRSDAKSDANCVRSAAERMPDGAKRHLKALWAKRAHNEVNSQPPCHN